MKLTLYGAKFVGVAPGGYWYREAAMSVPSPLRRLSRLWLGGSGIEPDNQITKVNEK